MMMVEAEKSIPLATFVTPKSFLETAHDLLI